MKNLNSLDEVFKTVETCQRCELHKFRDKCVFAEGKSNAEIMVIGLSPGKEENSSGKLFIGPSGNFLNELLRLAKVNRESLYITNIIKCHAPTYSIGKEEITACSIYLDRQMEIVNPRVIIPLGSIATQYILEKYNLPQKRISEIHGQLLHAIVEDLFNPNRDIKIIPMFHPAAALRSPKLLDSIKKDWQSLNLKGSK